MYRKKVDFLFILKILIIEFIFFLIGKKIVIFWIRLENIVNVGVIEIVFIYFVDWVVGDVVVIVIINYRYRQQETEQYIIVFVLVDKRILILE